MFVCRYLPSIYYRFVFSCGTFCFCFCIHISQLSLPFSLSLSLFLSSHPAALNGHHVRHGNTQRTAHVSLCCKCVCVCARCFYDCLFIYLAGSLGFPAGCFVLVLVLILYPLAPLPPTPAASFPCSLLSISLLASHTFLIHILHSHVFACGQR